MSLTDMVLIPGADYQSTCDAIREKAGGTDVIKSGQMPDAIGDVYEAGKKAMYNSVLDGGNRTGAEYAFYQWNIEYIHPPFVWKPKTKSSNCFNACKNLKAIEKQYFDFSDCPSGGTGSQGNYYTCYSCTNLEVFEDIRLPASDYTHTWSNCSNLQTIELVKSTKAINYLNTFNYCTSLTSIRFDGEIGQNISFVHSKQLSIESVVDILQHLYDYTTNDPSNAGTKTVVLSDDTKTTMAGKGAMTELDGKTYDAYIAGKGWTLS